MGININQVQFPDTARNPVSLRQISGGSYKAVELARELGGCLDDRYEQWKAGQTAELLSAYNARLYKRGEAVRLKKDNAVFTTTVQGVRASGKLVTLDALEREFSFGEVEWII
jgi:BirA family biotin operon repressor/biotin-[acetyl-CoA-carboxylase] ligase